MLTTLSIVIHLLVADFGAQEYILCIVYYVYNVFIFLFFLNINRPEFDIT